MATQMQPLSRKLIEVWRLYNRMTCAAETVTAKLIERYEKNIHHSIQISFMNNDLKKNITKIL
jgi:hypothetical protein